MKNGRWVSQRSQELLARRAEALKRYHNHRNDFNYAIWRSLVTEMDRSFADNETRGTRKPVKEPRIEEACERANTASRQNNTNEVFRIIKQLSGGTQSLSACSVTKRNSEPPESNEELMLEWAKYFEELLNGDEGNRGNEEDFSHIPPAETELAINISDFTTQEVTTAMELMKTGQFPGCDAIVAESLHYGGLVVVERLKEICNKVFNGKNPPSQWTRNEIVPIPKKNSNKMTNYRGISCVCACEDF